MHLHAAFEHFCYKENEGKPTETYLTFLLSNGDLMFGFQAGKTLFYSTYKEKCPESKTCPFHDPCCEEKRTKGKINHLLFTSEPIDGENIWTEMKNGELIGIDNSFNLMISNIDIF